MMKTHCILLLGCISTIQVTRADNFTVSNRQDAGAGSFRQAIIDANANPGHDTIDFDVSGSILLLTALPSLTDSVEIQGVPDGATATAPLVEINANGNAGLNFGPGSDGSSLFSLAIVNASGAAVTLVASHITIAGNYLGLRLDGSTVLANQSYGIHATPTSHHNLIGHADPIKDISYYAVNDASSQPVTAWQGIRGGETKNTYLICGTYGPDSEDGLLFIGTIDGTGEYHTINYPGAATTSVYGPDLLKAGRVRLVGSYKNPNASSATVKVNGFIYEGPVDGSGSFRTIDYPGGTYNYVHSTMGGLAVGNNDGPTAQGLPLGPGNAFLYDVKNATFLKNIVYPGSKSNTAYGIWYNGGTSYTICGGYSLDPVNNLTGRRRTPIGTAFLVDYDSVTKKFTNWTSFNYKNETGVIDFVTHFEGISSVEKGVYTLNADSVRIKEGDGPAQGSMVTVRRNPEGGFSTAVWIDLNYPESSGISSSNSIYGNQVVGLVIQKGGNFPFQATVNTGFQLSNVISGNLGDGIFLQGSSYNRISMNFIGTDVTGKLARGNAHNGIALTREAKGNIIGGQATGGNDPTGGTFVRPPQGNLISANGLSGVFIAGGSTLNSLSGNFIGTTAAGRKALGNARYGVSIVNADRNEILGTTFPQSPFVFYNVISGNELSGIRIKDSNEITVHANFMGIGSDNATVVANGGDGLLVEGTSQNVQCGGVIPLGNVCAGNDGNGIAVTDQATGFISFNTFAGLYAFGGAAPNQLDGIRITSTGGNNLLRTNVASGNLGNGIHIGGDAHGVTVDPDIVGLTTNGTEPLPNSKNGILIDGNAHHNVIGGDLQSVIPQNTVSGNLGHGIAIRGGAHHNRIFNTYIGTSATGRKTFGNGKSGIFLDEDTFANEIGGVPSLPNLISNNRVGLTCLGGSSSIENNTILESEDYGIYVRGDAEDTVIWRNTIQNSGMLGIYLDNARNLQIGGAVEDRRTDPGNTISSGQTSDATGILAIGRCTGTVVQGNLISENSGDGVELRAATGIRIGGPARNQRDSITDNVGVGFLATGNCQGSVAEGNVIVRNGTNVSISGAQGLVFIP